MKNLLTLLSILLIQLVYTQTILSKEIYENSLPPSAKLSATQYRQSTKLKYVKQPKFNLDNDLLISLFDGQIIRAKYIAQKQHGLSTPTYRYKIEGDNEGTVFFTDYENWVDGYIITGLGENFHITKTADQIYSVLKVNNDYFKDEECKSVKIDSFEEKNNFLGKSMLLHPSVCTSDPCANSVVDIMVLFSNQTINSVNGGVPAAKAATLNQVGILNQSLIDSGINNLTFNLVYAEAINHDDLNTNLNDDKNVIRSGALSAQVNALRDQYGADLVSIFCKYGTGIGDMSSDPTNFSSSQAYSAINYDYVMGSLHSLSHELGHNMGMNHEWETSNSVQPCEHFHGYTNQVVVQQGAATPADKRWRTTMSYGKACTDVGISCTRLTRWANPDLLYNGDPMGVPIGSNHPSDERYGLMRTACIVANYKSPALGVENTKDHSNELAYYPNPVKNKIFFSDEIKSYTIFNMEGRYIAGSNTKIKDVDVSYLGKGVYIINTILPNNKKQNFKFIKE